MMNPEDLVRIIFAPTAAGPWISVTERMPEEGGRVLAWSGGSLTGFAAVAYWFESAWLYDEDFGDAGDELERRPLDVTHWAEIRPVKESEKP